LCANFFLAQNLALAQKVALFFIVKHQLYITKGKEKKKPKNDVTNGSRCELLAWGKIINLVLLQRGKTYQYRDMS